MSSIILLHHLGLGDHFICHGIVREYAKRYERVLIFAKAANHESVCFMFRDLPHVSVRKVTTDQEAERIMRLNRFMIGRKRYDKVKKIGFGDLKESSGNFEKQFYTLAEVPLNKIWDSFHIARDQDREQRLFDRHAPKSKYAFLHEDAGRGYAIDRKKVDPSLTIFSPDKNMSTNICDYISTIQRAEEIHVIDSSFMFMIDCLKYDAAGQKLFIHRYARSNPEWQLPILKKNWIILT